jgi:N-acyl homoserine lactone hydrolase
MSSKRIWIGVLLGGLVLALGGFAFSFVAVPLPVPGGAALTLPEAHPPSGMRLSAIRTGKLFSRDAFARRGGAWGVPRTFVIGAILVQHPRGSLLFDAGFGEHVAQHVQSAPLLSRLLSQYELGTPAHLQLKAAGIDPHSLLAIVLTHAHWDHVSGIDDMRSVPIWLPQVELELIHSTSDKADLIRGFGRLPYQTYDFADGPYLGFERSYDVFRDGSVVLVPAPGHTLGSIIVFVALASGLRYALVGDLVWLREGIEMPAERPWLTRRIVDADAAQVREGIVHMHRIAKQFPKLIVVPAHDDRVWNTLPPLSRAGD